MLGVSGLLVGSVRLRPEALLLEGLAGGAVTIIAAAVLLRWMHPAIAAALAALVLVPYLLIVIGGGELLAHRRYVGQLTRPLARAIDQRSRPPRHRETSSDPMHHLLGLIVLDVALIIAGSAGMVQSALALGDRWHLSRAVLGTLILAPLTSVPNAVTGVRLGLAGRGAALVGETFNSNTINLAAGVIIPALFVSLGGLSTTATVQLLWLIAMTAFTLLALARPSGIRRAEAATLLVLYAGFASIQLLAP
jgi:Ca2+/Na+ antiporter